MSTPLFRFCLPFLCVQVSEAERDGNPEPGEDLTGDYHDLAVAVQGLGFLESGITAPLHHFSNTLLEFSALLRHNVRLHLMRRGRRADSPTHRPR